MTNASELSDREREIICLVATGASNKEIAQRLFISTNTVKVHLRNIFAKIGVTSRTEATLFAIREGLVPAPGNLPPQAAVGDEVKSTPIPGSEAVAQPPRRRAGMIALLSVAALVFLAMLGVTIRQLTAPPLAPAPQTPAPRWEERAPMPSPRSGLAAAVYEDQIYAIGGENTAGVTGEVQRYDPKKDTWMKLSDKPTPVTDAGAVAIGGKIYVPGGRLASGEASDSSEVYDPRTDRWEKRNRLPIRVSAYALSVLEGKLYLFGGWDGENYLKSVYEYDPDVDRWSRRMDMFTARAFAGAAAISSKIYVIGGFDGKKALNVNEVYTPDQDTGERVPWEKHKPIPISTYAMGMVGQAGIIYSIGGKTDAGAPGDALMYLYEVDRWQRIENPPVQIGSGLAIVAVNNYLYQLGGLVDTQVKSQNQAYQSIYTQSVPIIIR